MKNKYSRKHSVWHIPALHHFSAFQIWLFWQKEGKILLYYSWITKYTNKDKYLCVCWGVRWLQTTCSSTAQEHAGTAYWNVTNPARMWPNFDPSVGWQQKSFNILVIKENTPCRIWILPDFYTRLSPTPGHRVHWLYWALNISCRIMLV